MLDPVNALILIVTCLCSSVLSGIIGTGGAMLLIAVMAMFLPPAAIVPLHGVVQLVSSVTRGLFGFRHVAWRICGQYLCGAVIGAAVASQFVARIPPGSIPILLGAFVLIVTWMPGVQAEVRVPVKFLFFGAGITFLSLFVGATAGLLASLMLREGLGRDRYVVTVALLATISHALKIIAFGLLGFAFSPYASLLVGMILSVTLGSYVGTRLRGKVPEKPFRQALKILLTILALRMILKVTFA